MFLKCGYASIDQLTVDVPNGRNFVGCWCSQYLFLETCDRFQ